MYSEPLDPNLAAERLTAAWLEVGDAFREALAALPESERDHTEAYLGQVFDGTQMFHRASVGDLIEEVCRTLRGEVDLDDDYEAAANAGDPHRSPETWGEALGIDEGPDFWNPPQDRDIDWLANE